MKQLIIAEKPSVARDLAQVLGATKKTKTYIEGPNVIITWALGHLLGLKMPEDYNKEWAQWNMETLPMIPKKVGIKPLPKTGHQLKAISQLAKRQDVSEAVIATDAGREGELVARWILEYVRFNKPVKRLWISSQTTKAIKDGFKKLEPSKHYDNLYRSALARAEADWLVGLNVTRALTVKYEDNLSAGRVQTPTLAMVRKQEERIENFRAENFYTIDLTYGGLKGRLQLKNPRQFSEREQAEQLVDKLVAQKTLVTSVKSKQKKELAPLPYDLTEIQREANQRFGFSAKKTLGLVQNLYEIHKVVTYPRTDSKYLTRDMASTMKERLQAVASYYPDEAKAAIRKGSKVQVTKVFQDEKVTDHHALIPTEQVPRAEKMDNDEQKIYQMITKRFLGLFGDAHITEQQTIEAKNAENIFLFKQTKIIQPGFKVVKQEDIQKQVEFKEGMTLNNQFQLNKEITSPPAALSEGSLLGLMEKHKLGTPATRAEIIEKLIKSELMSRTANKLAVTPKGKQLLKLVNPSLVSPDLTEKWESALEEIAQGKRDGKTFIKEIEEDTTKLVKEIKYSEQKYTDFSLTNKECPECGEALREKNTRDGKIYVCTGETCKYRRRKDPKVSNRRCPQCHKKMEIHEGKNGQFFKCKTCVITEKIESGKGRKKKMTKHEEKKLLKKYSQSQASEPEESPLALALKAAMKDN
ncbi:DNA topoisomerase 3 [Vagococcus intermedius]|uniref:DNA topoisomerase n=1 Tax=Vagococcus intermedius TaxID=2991418 RepID=A0AAF0CU68_9ENTE|nr:DNA topoisomerase 3 [Vagococcus intermedius]WEG72951.1 DNA topoisomerase 3 [Vagococcus intermedius]WEG75037.1 DNA topoisomerase 3 [Vagococcus intermedius]